MSLRVLVADDQDLVRTGLRMILEAEPDIEVVAEAPNGKRAVELARTLRPDVCLLDIRMPVMDGIEATRLLSGPDVRDPIPVVVITTFDLDELVHAALKAGARGFLLKDAGPALLAAAIRAAASGEALIAPAITARLLAPRLFPLRLCALDVRHTLGHDLVLLLRHAQAAGQTIIGRSGSRVTAAHGSDARSQRALVVAFAGRITFSDTGIHT